MKIRHLIPALGLLALASCKTAAPAAPDRFVQADTDKDGRLSKDEMKKGRDLMRAKMRVKFEADRNNILPPTPEAAPTPAPMPAQ